MQAPVLFVIAADLERMELKAAIDEADIGGVRPGQVARFTVVRDGRRLTLPVTLATRTGSG
jgi:S1-C subfamily serine protease